MADLTKLVRPKGVVIAAEANFTMGMAQNLLSMFDHLQQDQEVTVQLSNKGVWAVTPNGIRLFIGSTKVFKVGSSGQGAARPHVH